MTIERTVTVNQSDPNRGRYDPSRMDKPNPADTEPYPATSPEAAEATRAELAELRHRTAQTHGPIPQAGADRGRADQRGHAQNEGAG